MSLTLKDDQEKALRAAWCAWWFAYENAPLTGDKSQRLHVTVTPLMKPWRVSGPFDHQVIRDHETNRSVEVKCYGSAMKDYQDLARRICDLLNESEGK